MNSLIMSLESRVNRLEGIIRSKVDPSLPSEPPKRPSEIVLDVVSQVWDVHMEVLLSPNRQDKVAEARKAVVGLLLKWCDYNQTQIGELLGRVPSAINKAKCECKDLLATCKHFQSKYKRAEEMIKERIKL